MKAWNQGAGPGISRWIQQNRIISKMQDSFNWLWSEGGVPRRTGQRETPLVALWMGERGHEPRETGSLSQLEEPRGPSLWNSPVAQWLGCGSPGGSDGSLPAMQETRVQSLGREDPLEEDTATHSSILAWRIPRTEEPGGLQSMGSQRVGH